MLVFVLVLGTHLHAYDGVDEEEHGYQQDHIRQGLHISKYYFTIKLNKLYLEGLNKSPKQNPNCVTLPE